MISHLDSLLVGWLLNQFERTEQKSTEATKLLKTLTAHTEVSRPSTQMALKKAEKTVTVDSTGLGHQMQAWLKARGCHL